MPLPNRHATPEEEAAQHPWVRFYLSNQLDSPFTYGASLKEYLELEERELRQIKATYYAMMTKIAPGATTERLRGEVIRAITEP